MATESYIQNLIDTNLADDSDILPSEHRAVEDALLGEFFPNSVKLEWDGDSVIDPITDIVVNPDLTEQGKVYFKIYFTKHGNRVFYNGIVASIETSRLTPNLVLATFPTTLYRPLENFSSYSRLTNTTSQAMLSNTIILLQSTGIVLGAGVPINSGINIYSVEGSYKVAN